MAAARQYSVAFAFAFGADHVAARAQVLAFYVKLGALLVKQISKPLASALKSQAVAHPSLREVLTRVGQRMHEYNLRITQQLKSDGEIATGRKARPPPRPGLRWRGGRNPGARVGTARGADAARAGRRRLARR